MSARQTQFREISFRTILSISVYFERARNVSHCHAWVFKQRRRAAAHIFNTKAEHGGENAIRGRSAFELLQLEPWERTNRSPAWLKKPLRLIRPILDLVRSIRLIYNLGFGTLHYIRSRTYLCIQLRYMNYVKPRKHCIRKTKLFREDPALNIWPSKPYKDKSQARTAKRNAKPRMGAKLKTRN